MKSLLQELKSNYNIKSLKLDLASEAVSREEFFAYSELAQEMNLPLTVKIGGCDASTDIYIAKEINANTILAPMIESPYALKKFTDNCKQIYGNNLNDINLYINIETITAYKNLDSILNCAEAECVQGIVVGRDDMANSSGIDLSDINSSQMLEIVQCIADKVYLYNKKFIIGGQIRPDATEFLNSISKEKLSGYETRRIVFSYDEKQVIEKEGIIKAIEFEMKWLNYIKNSFNNDIVENRITELTRSMYELCS